jgi:hypothetical protein
VVEAASRQPDLRGRPPPPRETRSPSRRGRRGRSRPLPVGSLRPPAATARRTRPDRRCVVVAVVKAASRQSDLRGRPLPPCETRLPPRRGRHGRSHPPHHGCRCVAWWGRERRTAAALILIVVVSATLVNDHLLLLEHGPLRVGDDGRGGMMTATMVGTMGIASHCAPRRPCLQSCRAVALSRASCAIAPQFLGEEREREKRG